MTCEIQVAHLHSGNLFHCHCFCFFTVSFTVRSISALCQLGGDLSQWLIWSSCRGIQIPLQLGTGDRGEGGTKNGMVVVLCRTTPLGRTLILPMFPLDAVVLRGEMRGTRASSQNVGKISYLTKYIANIVRKRTVIISRPLG